MERWQILHNEQRVAESASALPFIKFNKHDFVLDMGCGSGKQLHYLTKKYSSFCVGIDIVPFKFSNFLISDACHLPFRSGIFDIVYSLGVIEHLKLTHQAVKESKRILRNRGQCLHSVPNVFSLHTFIERPLTDLLFKDWSVGFEQSFTSRKMKTMFYNCGFHKINQKIKSKSVGESKIFKLSKVESLIYQFIKEMDRLLSKIIPNWGFFLFTYARALNSNRGTCGER